ncbi:MAG: hypothetical protein IPL96_02110 [Holophagaceae bacterium]|nr:hypothetical protein [Holophagaceae bacterium]
MNRKLTTLATLFAAGAFAATAMTPKMDASAVKNTADKSLVETGCGADKKDGKDASCGKDKKDMKDHKCGKDMKDGKCGKEHKCGKDMKDGKCGKEKKAGKDKKEKSCGAGSCGSKKN